VSLSKTIRVERKPLVYKGERMGFSYRFENGLWDTLERRWKKMNRPEYPTGRQLETWSQMISGSAWGRELDCLRTMARSVDMHVHVVRKYERRD
jgi:hypothetical protein